MSPVVTSPRGITIPSILYGTAWKKEKTAALVERAITLGFRGVDTACQPKHYDEAGVGAGVAAACLARSLDRQALYLQTKFTPVAGQDPRSIPYDPEASPERQLQQSSRVSLANLRTTYLDCLVLHSPISPSQRMLQYWQAMEGLVEMGTVKALGISNCYELGVLEALWHAAKIKPLVVQNRFYKETGFDGAIRAFCAGHGMLYQSFWTLTANPQILAHPRLLALASKYGVTPAQLLFRCLTQMGIIVLSGTTSEQHMQDDLAIFDFSLQESELASLALLFE